MRKRRRRKREDKKIRNNTSININLEGKNLYVKHNTDMYL